MSTYELIKHIKKSNSLVVVALQVVGSNFKPLYYLKNVGTYMYVVPT